MTDIDTGQIGPRLRERRLELKLSPEEVAAQTRIRKTYLLALEDERFDELPGKVYVIGFLQNYARVLGIPSEPLVEALTPPLDEAARPALNLRPVRQTITPLGVKKKSRVPLLLILLGVLVGAGVLWLLVTWGGSGSKTDVAPQVAVPDKEVAAPAVAETAEPQAGVPVSEPADNVPATEEAAEAEPVDQKIVEASPSLPPGGGTVKVVVAGHGRFQVAVDEGRRRDYVAKPGLSLSWRVQQKIDLALDVDGKVRLLIDGKEYVVAGNRHLKMAAAEAQGD